MTLLTVRIRRVVVENTASGPVEAAHYHKMTLVLRLPAETLLAHRQEAAVLDGRGAEFTCQDHGVDQHYSNVALLQMRLDFLNRHRAMRKHPQNTCQVLGLLCLRQKLVACPNEYYLLTENSPFLHHHTIALCFEEELIHSVFFCIKVFLVEGLHTKRQQRHCHTQKTKNNQNWLDSTDSLDSAKYLIPEALINTQSLRAKAVFDS